MITESLEPSIAWLKKEIQDLNQKMDNILQGSELQPLFNLLNSIKGLGSVTIANLLGDLPELGTLSSKEIAKLVGVAPSSDKREGLTSLSPKNHACGRG